LALPWSCRSWRTEQVDIIESLGRMHERGCLRVHSCPAHLERRPHSDAMPPCHWPSLGGPLSTESPAQSHRHRPALREPAGRFTLHTCTRFTAPSLRYRSYYPLYSAHATAQSASISTACPRLRLACVPSRLDFCSLHLSGCRSLIRTQPPTSPPCPSDQPHRGESFRPDRQP
jgi:hypothetical protein